MLRKRWFLLLLVSGALAGCIAFNTTNKAAQPDLSVMKAQGKQAGPSDASPLTQGFWGGLGKFLNDNEGTWAAVGAVGTIVVSALAVYLAWAANKQQLQVDIREKREELRGILDHLIDLRPSANAQKQNLYLQAAQAIQKQIPNELTSADYIVLGEENKAISSFRQAREFFAKAVNRADSSSAYEKSTALRFLADTYYYYPLSQGESEIEKIKHGRKLYKESISILEENESDPHVMHTECFSYMRWVKAESYKNNLAEAQSKLRKIFQIHRKIPDDFHLKIDTLLGLSEKCMEVGVKYFYYSRKINDETLVQNGHYMFAAADNALNIAYRILPHFPGRKPEIDRMKAAVLFTRCLHQLRSEHEANEVYYNEAKNFATPQLLQDHKLDHMWKEISSMREKRQFASSDKRIQV